MPERAAVYTMVDNNINIIFIIIIRNMRDSGTPRGSLPSAASVVRFII